MAWEVSSGGYKGTTLTPASEDFEEFKRYVKELEEVFINEHKKDSFLIIADFIPVESRGMGMGFNENYVVIALKNPTLANVKSVSLWLYPEYQSTFPARVEFTIKCTKITYTIYNRQKNPHIDGNVLSPVYYKLINRKRKNVVNVTVKAEVKAKDEVKSIVFEGRNFYVYGKPIVDEFYETVSHIRLREIYDIINSIIQQKLAEMDEEYRKLVKEYCHF